MRKNRMMRAASALLVAVLLTTSTISGTFAKYVTTASGSDTARVAKWGVEVGVTGSLFAEDYLETTNTPATGAVGETYSVIAVSEENVVAPGTKNENGLTFKITGTPEVKTEVKVEVGYMDDDNFVSKDASDDPVYAKDVVVPKGVTLPDYTKVTGYEKDGSGNDDITKPIYGTFTLANDYHPLKFTLKKAGAVVSGCENVALSVIENYLEGTNVSSKYDANEDLSTVLGEYNITWIWNFDDDGAGTYDKEDTLLGQIAAGKTTVTDASTGVNIAIKVTVTQVD